MNKTVPPDTIVDVRLRVPAGHKINRIMARDAESRIPGFDQVCEIIDQWPAPAEPTFEAGKSYRTRGGDKATIEDVGVAEPGYMVGRINGGPNFTWSWLLSGRIRELPDFDSLMDLLPGAIEDEKAEMNVYSPEQYERLSIQGFDGRLKAMEKGFDLRMKALEAAVADRATVTIDLRQIHSRINRQAERIASVDDLRAFDSKTLERRIKALEEQMTSALGITLSSRPRPATPVEQAINALRERLDHQSEAIDQIDQINQNADRRLNELENYTGLDVRSARKSKLGQVTMVDSASWTGRIAPSKPPKPTIKGGWVNVYSNPGYFGVGDIHPNRETARRVGGRAIACIQIPDITEGEGL